MTTKFEIEEWFDEGVKMKARYMVVVCDTFDHEDYPCYCFNDEDCLKRIKEPGSMQRVMEVYDFQIRKDKQFAETRAYHPPKAAA